MNKLKNNKGFTLVELLVAIAILGIVIAPLANSFIMSAKMNTMAKLDAEAMTIAQGYMENVKALKEFPTTNVVGNDIVGALPPISNPNFEATVELVPNVLYENKQDDTATGGGTGSGIPGKIYNIYFSDSATGGVSYDNASRKFVIPCTGVNNSKDVIFKEGKLWVDNHKPLFDCDNDIIKIYVKDGGYVLTEDFTIRLRNESADATKSMNVFVVSPQDFDKNCNVVIGLGKAKVSRNITGIPIEKVSNNILYEVVVRVKYIYDGEDKYVEVVGEKIF